jgi:NAD(P)H-quinone oxidoreductase subunit 6
MIALNWFDIVFFVFGFILIASSVMVAFSRNLIYSAFSLMGALVSVAVLFVLLSADFLAVTQILIYMGGILVLILFAIMLTSTIRDVRISNRYVGEGPAFLISLITFIVLVVVSFVSPWLKATNLGYEPTTREIGNNLLSKYILPFEIASVLLLIAVVGAVVLARKEVKRR